jgi:hypothetical protein
MSQDGIMPQKYQSLEELQERDPSFDFEKAHTFYPKYGGRILVMIFVQEITEPVDLHYFLDGEKIFENRAKFQILYKWFGQKDIYTISTFPSFYTTREKAEEGIPLIVEKKTGWDKMLKEEILEFVNRAREDEED